MPAGTIYVGRPSRWGNPYDMWSDLPSKNQSTNYREECLERYREWLIDQLKANPHYLDPLRGHDIACWCPLTLPCHGDIIIDFVKKQGRGLCPKCGGRFDSYWHVNRCEKETKA